MDLYRGSFNLSGQVVDLHTQACSPEQAKRNMLTRLVAVAGYDYRHLAREFSGQRNNFIISMVRRAGR